MYVCGCTCRDIHIKFEDHNLYEVKYIRVLLFLQRRGLCFGAGIIDDAERSNGVRAAKDK